MRWEIALWSAQQSRGPWSLFSSTTLHTTWPREAPWSSPCRLTMGKTAHGSPAGELSNIFQRVRRDDEDPQLLTFIPMEVSMSPTHTPMRHSLQYMRPQYLRRTPANVFAYTAAYVPDTDGSHWRGF